VLARRWRPTGAQSRLRRHRARGSGGLRAAAPPARRDRRALGGTRERGASRGGAAAAEQRPHL